MESSVFFFFFLVCSAMSEQPKRVLVCIDESKRPVTLPVGLVGLKKEIQQKFEN